jgi:hypothetical protein
MQTHSDEKPFQCEFCPKKKYSSRAGLYYHKKKAHGYEKKVAIFKSVC